nr:putative uncharacterized protein DDB_G0282133 [Halyomorpha halys]
MERTIIAPEFKGGIWHRFFSTVTKKDETLVSILDEKIRYYKLYYPFLEKKQITGKAYEELGIPHICGDLNRKELYKLYLKERKNQCKLKEKYKKYPALLIENKSKNKGTMKKPTISSTKQTKVSACTNVDKSKEDFVFDNLLSSINPKRKEGMIQPMNFKQTKSVRFNDGIEVHSVSPSQPLYKLKPLGRLFDEPSALRGVDTPSYSQQELKERIDDSDSDFDADTGITSDAEDYDLEDSRQMEDSSKNTEIDENEKVEENNLPNTKTKTIYDCSEDDLPSIDDDIRKEGNELILSTKMITVVQGKWVRETTQIIGNTCYTEDMIIPNRKSAKEDVPDDRQEFSLVSSIENILESIKSLCISSSEEHRTSSDIICSTGSEPNMKVKKEQLMEEDIEAEQELIDIKITIQDKNEQQTQNAYSKNINSKISLEKDLSTHLIDEKLLTIDNNKLSYDHDVYEIKSDMDGSSEKRIRTKPIKLVDDLIDYINDWNSSKEGSLNYSASQTSSTRPIFTNNPEKDEYVNAKGMKTMMGDEVSSNYSLIEEKSCLNNEEDYSEKSFLEEKRLEEQEDTSEKSLHEEECLDKEEDSSEKTFLEGESLDKEEDNSEKSFLEEENLEKEENSSEKSFLEEKHWDKEEDNLKDLSLEKHSLIDQNSYLLSSDNNNQQISSQLFESNVSLNSNSQSVEIIKIEHHDSLTNFNAPSPTRNQVSEEKEFQTNDTFTIIKSMVCSQNISNPNELYSTFYSLITKPILVQSQHLVGKGSSQDNYSKLKSFEVEELAQEKKKMETGYPITAHELESGYCLDSKTQGLAKGENEIEENISLRLSVESSEKDSKEDVKIMSGSKLLTNSQIVMIPVDNSNSILAGQIREKENRDNISIIYNTNKKLFNEEPENILDDIGTAKKDEGNMAFESETSSTNFLSKVQMWSFGSKKSSDNSAMVSQSSSLLAICNTDSWQKKVLDIEDRNKTTNECDNESYHNNSSNEDSLISGSNKDSIFEELDTSDIDLETGSSAPITPIKIEKYNSDELSTAYETDPETGKLVMNRLLHPVTSSTPIKLKQQDSISERRPDETSLEELSANVFHSVKGFDDETKKKHSLSTSVIDESTIKSDSQYRSENVPSDLCQLVAYDKRSETEINNALNKSEKLGENSVKEIKNDLNDSDEFSIEKQSEVPSAIYTPVFQNSNSNKSNSKSIIENSETDSQRTFKKEKNSKTVKLTVNHPVCIDMQKDKLAIERYDIKTNINPTKISFTSNIQNSNTFTVSETPDIYTCKQRSSNEVAYGSSLQTNEFSTSKKEVTLNLKPVDKTTGGSNSTDIIYDTSSITEDYNSGKHAKISTEVLANTTKGEHNISENENELNISDELIRIDNKNRLSAVSESIVNNNTTGGEYSITENQNEPNISDELIKTDNKNNLSAVSESIINNNTTEEEYNTSEKQNELKISDELIKTDNKNNLSAVSESIINNNTTEGEHNISENENELNISDELIKTDNKNNLSSVSECIINNNSKMDDKFTSSNNEKEQRNEKSFKTNQQGAVLSHPLLIEKQLSVVSGYKDLKNEGEKRNFDSGIHESVSKKIVKNRQGNVSHVTFLIRDPRPPEERPSIIKFGYQKFMDSSQLDSTSKIKQYYQNKVSNTNEILLAATKVQTAEDINDVNVTLKLPNSNLTCLANNSSHLSIGVQNSHFESPLLSTNEKHKYLTRSCLRLKRKLGTIDENESESDMSLSQDELARKEIKKHVSSNIHLIADEYFESPVTTETSSIEMNLKRVNTDIRRKRAKLKREIPRRKSSTSSSEDEIKKPLPKRKILETSKVPVHKFTESNIKIKQSNKFDFKDNIDSVDIRTQQNIRKSDAYDEPRNFPNLAHSSKKEALKRQREIEHNQSDSSSSIIYSSPNAKTILKDRITKTHDRSKINFDNKVKKRHMEKQSQYFSVNVNIDKQRNERSHKSFPLYRKHDGSNKENSNIPLKDLRPSNEYPKKPLMQFNPGTSHTVLHTQKYQNSEAKNLHQNIKKNRKSSIVRLMDTAEASQISHSPEVKGLLRRTYFMGNH